MEHSSGVRIQPASDLSVHPGFGRQAAHAISNVFSPPVFGVVGIFASAAVSGTWNALLWAVLFTAIAVGIPVLYIVWQLRLGKISDFHLRIRSERFKPMIVQILSLLTAAALLWTGPAPAILLETALWGASISVFLLAVTLFWKISGHSTAAASFSVFMGFLFGPEVSPLLLLIPVVGWARVRIKRHTPAQVLAGTLTGLLFTIGFMFLLHLWHPGG